MKVKVDGNIEEFPDDWSKEKISEHIKARNNLGFNYYRDVYGDSPVKKHMMGLLYNFNEGSMLGFGDEVTGTLGQGVNLLAGTNPGINLNRSIQDSEDIRKGYKEEHPWLATGAEVLGTIPTAIATRGFGQNALATTRPVVAGMKAGAISGGITGVGKGEGWEGRGIGGLLGAGIGMPIGALGGLFSNWLGNKFGDKAARDALSEQVTKTVSDNADDVAKQMAAKGQMVVDTGPRTEGLAMGVAANTDKAQKIITDKTGQRAAEAYSQVKDKIVSNVPGLRGKELANTVDDALNIQRTAASPLFEATKKEVVDATGVGALDKEVTKMLTSQEMSNVPSATKALQNLQKMIKVGDPKEGIYKTSGEGLMIARKEFGKKIKDLLDKGKITQDTYNKLSTVREFFDNIMPESYKKANAIFSPQEKIINAVEAGSGFFKSSPNQIVKDMAKLSDSEKTGYLTGVATDLLKRIGTKAADRPVSPTIFSENMKDRLTSAFGKEIADGIFAEMKEKGAYIALNNGIKTYAENAARSMAAGTVQQATQQGMTPLSTPAIAAKTLTEIIGRTKGLDNKQSEALANMLVQKMTPELMKKIINGTIPENLLKTIPSVVPEQTVSQAGDLIQK